MVSKTAIPFLNPPPRPSGAKGLHRGAGVVAPAPGEAGTAAPQKKPQPRQRQKTVKKPEGPLKKKQASASAQRRAAHKAELERRILDAARALFAEQGFEAVTLREVAAAVGYSHATIYSFFADKADLLARLAGEARQGLVDALAGQVEGDAAAPKVALRRAVAAYLRWAATHPHHYRLLLREAPQPEVYALLRRLAAGLAVGGGDIELRTQTLWAALHGAALLELEQAPAGGLPWGALEARITALAELLGG